MSSTTTTTTLGAPAGGRTGRTGSPLASRGRCSRSFSHVTDALWTPPAGSAPADLPTRAATRRALALHVHRAHQRHPPDPDDRRVGGDLRGHLGALLGVLPHHPEAVDHHRGVRVDDDLDLAHDR